MLPHQFLDRGKRLVAGLDTEFEIALYLTDYASRFLIRAE